MRLWLPSLCLGAVAGAITITAMLPSPPALPAIGETPPEATPGAHETRGECQLTAAGQAAVTRAILNAQGSTSQPLETSQHADVDPSNTDALTASTQGAFRDQILSALTATSLRATEGGQTQQAWCMSEYVQPRVEKCLADEDLAARMERMAARRARVRTPLNEWEAMQQLAAEMPGVHTSPDGSIRMEDTPGLTIHPPIDGGPPRMEWADGHRTEDAN